MIRLIDYHNHHWRVPQASLDPELVRAGVPPYPIELWRWGCQNRPGHLHQIDPEHVRVNLLPGGDAVTTTSRDGLSFKGLDYQPPAGMLASMLRGAGVRSKSLPVAFDPRDAGILYLRSDRGRRIVPCPLHPRHAQFAGFHRDIVEHFLEQRELNKERAKGDDEQAWVDHDSALTDIARRGNELRKSVVATTGALPTTSDRRAHRTIERVLGPAADRIRQAVSGDTARTDQPAPPSRIPADDAYVGRSDDLTLFEQLSDVDHSPSTEDQV